MSIRSLSRVMPMSLLFISLSLFVLAGCGSNTSSSGSSSNTSISTNAATATACAQATRPASAFRTAIGTLKSINGQMLVVTNQQGTDIAVTYTSSTIFTKESTIPVASLQEGTSVRATVVSSGGTYTASTVTVISSGTGSGFPGGTGTPGAGGRGGFGNNPCFARGRFGSPGASGTPGTTFRGIVGKISQVSSNLLVVTDTAGASYSLTLTPQTQIVGTNSVTATALKVGQPLTVVGMNKQGTIVANTVTILLSLPTRPTLTPTA